MLAPEHDFTGELNIERHWKDGRVRLTVFKEHTDDALISQTNTVINAATGAQSLQTSVSNVVAIQMQGVELSADTDNVLIDRLQQFGSITYVDSKILSDPDWAGVNPLTNLPDSVVGKRVPYVPDWRAKVGVTYVRTTAGPTRSRRATAASNIRRWIIPTLSRMYSAPSTTISWST